MPHRVSALPSSADSADDSAVSEALRGVASVAASDLCGGVCEVLADFSCSGFKTGTVSVVLAQSMLTVIEDSSDVVLACACASVVWSWNIDMACVRSADSLLWLAVGETLRLSGGWLFKLDIEVDDRRRDISSSFSFARCSTEDHVHGRTSRAESPAPLIGLDEACVESDSPGLLDFGVCGNESAVIGPLEGLGGGAEGWDENGNARVPVRRR